jgi:hypothetical protein
MDLRGQTYRCVYMADRSTTARRENSIVGGVVILGWSGFFHLRTVEKFDGMIDLIYSSMELRLLTFTHGC